ncbi:nitrilase-related carbon-nitrogen hydrolase [Dyella silvatica]|uniref:nitrilase-related carbon-nitrogen hydrolase n=1 Tax=Dyella silvatica TaxID=2992128 RepID=UPI0022553B5F|nr:nitrilase-related carbon-nitrogen hydrolase [Dyella silvatica]
MASRPDGFVRPAWLAATALAALGWWFGSGLHPLWWLSWLAPLPVLWLAPRVSAPSAALAAFVAYAIGGLNQWTYMHTYIGLPLPVIAYATGLPSLILVLCVLLYRRLLWRGHTLAAAFAPPALWVACEYINNLLSPHGTFGSIAYTQIDALPVIQVAAIGGIWAISFLLLLVPAAIAVQTAPLASKQGRVSAAAIAAICIAFTVAYGSWRLQAPATTTMRIGLASLQKPIMPSLQEPRGQALEARYAEAMTRLANAGAQTVLIPETSLTTTDATVPAFAELAKQRGLTVAAGINFKGDPSTPRNMLTVLQPGATSPATYSKHHLLIGLEEYTPGDSYTLLQGTPRIGLAICKDLDFHDTGHAYATRNTQLLLVPASDFIVDGWLHSRMAIMRSVESGFAMARAARNGRLTLSDDRGRVVAEASSEQRDAELVGDLPLRDTHTLYTRWGDWLVWFDLGALAASLALAFRWRRAAA